MGQAAYLMANPDQVGSTFFASIPFGDGFYWCFFVVATAAACVASQACSHPNPKPGTSSELISIINIKSHADVFADQDFYPHLVNHHADFCAARYEESKWIEDAYDRWFFRHWFGAVQLPLATLPICSLYRQSRAGLAACF